MPPTTLNSEEPFKGSDALYARRNLFYWSFLLGYWVIFC